MIQYDPAEFQKGDRVNVRWNLESGLSTPGTIKRVEIGESGIRLYHVRWDDGFVDDDPWTSGQLVSG